MANKKKGEEEKDPSDEEETFSEENGILDASIIEDTFADEDYSDFNDVDSL